MHWLALLETEHYSNSKVNGTSFQHQWMPFSQRDAVEQILNKSNGMQITGTLFDKTGHAMYLDHISSFFLQFLTSNGGLGPWNQAWWNIALWPDVRNVQILRWWCHKKILPFKWHTGTFLGSSLVSLLWVMCHWVHSFRKYHLVVICYSATQLFNQGGIRNHGQR